MNSEYLKFFYCAVLPDGAWRFFWTGLHSLFTGQKTLTGKDFSFDVSHLRLCRCYCSTVRQNYFLPFFTVESCILPDSILWNSSVEAS